MLFPLKILMHTKRINNPKGSVIMSGNGRKQHSSEKTKRNGFYLALAICLVAVGIAAWSTYDAVNGYVSTEDPNTTVTNSMATQPEATAKPKAAADDEDGEAVNKQTESSKATETNAAVESKVESEPAPIAEEPSDSGFISQVEEYGVPVNAGTIYEISSVLTYPVESKENVAEYSKGIPVYSSTMKDWRIHNGLDIKATEGEAVKAAGNGIVTQTLTDPKLGNVVVIEHGEYEFWYCGLGEDFMVNVDDIVTAGQQIGVITAVPFESAEDTHLHLEVKRDDVYLNPIEVLSAE